MLGQPVEILIPEVLRTAHLEHRAGFLADPRPRSMAAGRSVHARRKDGTLFLAEIGLNPIETEAGIVIVVSVVDITVRQQSEQLWRHYAAIVESYDDAIISKCMEGIITSWNASAERIFGYMAKEAIDRPMTMLFPPDLLDEEVDFLRRIARGERITHWHTKRRPSRWRKFSFVFHQITETIQSALPPSGPHAGKLGPDRQGFSRTHRKRKSQEQTFSQTS